MVKASRAFQVFAKPAGSVCNLQCHYCYYLKKEDLYGKGESFRMPDDILEEYIAQHIDASSAPVISFSWHGGEPTILGLDYFRKVVALQRKHRPPGRRISNGIQTNGTLINEEWGHFLATEGFAVGISLDGPKELHDRYRVGKKQEPTHERAIRGYRLLRQHGIPPDILCVVHARNVRYPIEVYRFFKEIGASYIGFLPLVQSHPDGGGVSDLTAPAEAFGDFLCTIFDEWLREDIGRIKVQIFEEAQRHSGRNMRFVSFGRAAAIFPSLSITGTSFPAITSSTPNTTWGTSRRLRWSSCSKAHHREPSDKPSWMDCPTFARPVRSSPCATAGVRRTACSIRRMARAASTTSARAISASSLTAVPSSQSWQPYGRDSTSKAKRYRSGAGPHGPAPKQVATIHAPAAAAGSIRNAAWASDGVMSPQP
jgi:MoaA/NifB/PqqE/SkfB family radical SAM enzyme